MKRPLTIKVEDNLKIFLVDPITKESELIVTSHNNLCQVGMRIFAKTLGGGDNYMLTHLTGLFNTGIPPSFDEKTVYADFDAEAVTHGGSVVDVPLQLKSYRSHQPVIGDIYDSNVLEMQSTFTYPNNGIGDTVEAIGLTCILPGGQKYLGAVYVDNVVKPFNKHLSFTWSVQFLVG